MPLICSMYYVLCHMSTLASLCLAISQEIIFLEVSFSGRGCRIPKPKECSMIEEGVQLI